MKQQIFHHNPIVPVNVEQEFRNIYKELNNLPIGSSASSSSNFLDLSNAAEIEVGIWIDGRKIYRQIATVSAYPNATNGTILTIPDINRLLFAFGYANSGSSTYLVPAPGSDTSNHDCCLVGQSTNDIVVITTSNWSTYSGYIVVYYTK